ncbi:DUF4179 domain-containing protein [Clostridium estertheticum]|uniref:DUF4179 domain-containing protein n=1 Tax=Clostridium estertheticum TaxID=238834 RepID=A0AA47ELF4_9CLOT|nr:DUF4179 domain-containing protein [Clostridium estertheticum]MBU3156724.1 DUF4179 domain-containing protein [Clostridium estertheticum]MBU3199099.1 DUF4179 domain-containing protein [Clostridium estertheticum]WAG62250.1 DUF4179 domain-containing protein [Clostridium estertheticum]WAG63638.1 DUF4179 domain-containing protein [Clostridium estertheticum]
MLEKDVFEIVDNLTDNELNVIMDKTYLSKDIKNDVCDYDEKEKIRAKLYERVNKSAKQNITIKQNIINNEDEYKSSLDGAELNPIKKSKKRIMVIKNKLIRRLLISAVAAMLVFVVSTNISPSVARALDNIPVLNKLVEFIKLDKGFDNVISSGNIQEGNITVENKGAKFTVTSVAGDKLKLWIGYELEDKGLILGKIKFKNKVDNKELPWGVIPNKKYLEVIKNESNVKDFIMEIDVYKDDVMFHKPIAELDKKTIKRMIDLSQKNKIATLSIPISLSNKIYKSDLATINVVGKQVNKESGIFKIEKLELSKSRSKVYCKLVSKDNDLVGVVNPILIDENGKEYSSPKEKISSSGENNTICLELEGGIASEKGLTFKCDGFKYINKKDKYITIDLENKIIEPNNLGVAIVSIKESKITLKAFKSIVQFNFGAKNEKGNDIPIKTMETNSLTKKEQVIEFKSLKDKKIILNVESVMDSEATGVTIKF